MRSRTRLVALLLVAGYLSAPAARGQADLAPGTSVRVTSGGAERTTGRVEQVTSDSLLISKDAGGQLAFTWGDVRRVETRRSTRQVLPFMLGGGGAGLLIGGLIGFVSSETESTLGNPDFVDEDAVNRGALIGAGVSVVVGGLIGFLVRRERWEVVPHGAAFGARYPGIGATVTVRL